MRDSRKKKLSYQNISSSELNVPQLPLLLPKVRAQPCHLPVFFPYNPNLGSSEMCIPLCAPAWREGLNNTPAYKDLNSLCSLHPVDSSGVQPGVSAAVQCTHPARMVQPAETFVVQPGNQQEIASNAQKSSFNLDLFQTFSCFHIQSIFIRFVRSRSRRGAELTA